MSKLYLFCLLAIFWTSEAYSEQMKVLKIAAIDWCPQICPREEPDGYVVDLINKIYAHHIAKIEIHYYPWSRAIKYVAEGKYDALLSPAKKEAPHLIFPKFAVGSQQMCFFTLIEDHWKYTGVESLKNRNIGVAKDSSVEELNDYLTDNPNQFQYQPYHDRYFEQNYKKLKKGRINSLIFTKNTTIWELNKIGKLDKINNAGCVSRAPIYIAFTPVKSKAAKVTQLIGWFDVGMYESIVNGYAETVLKKYGLSSNTILKVPIKIEQNH